MHDDGLTKEGPINDAAHDAVGKSSFGRCRPLLKPRGIYLSTDLDPLSMNPILAVVTRLFGGKRGVLDPAEARRGDVDHVRGLLE